MTTTQRTYLRGYVDRAAADEGGPIRFVAVTEGRKGDGLDLRMDRADLTRFAGNPVIGYGHNYHGRESLPIGRADHTWIDGGRLMVDVVFDAKDEFAAAIERKIRDGFLNAVSAGFDVHDVDHDGVPARWELFEVSVVPLPLDPEALTEADRDGHAALRSLNTDHDDERAQRLKHHHHTARAERLRHAQQHWLR
ncbi:hypothetical protein [Streptomyces sp. MUM 178J]|uniref:hypothetical protein n=1 Tax=Streptomyces sp. MUM 178J TaxID=2791991 RepID=UPI001F03DC0C|nr:hypothetical protein [Streptomyces sp. MUM 178J]WRQ80291.1 hypothetical protein I3F59_013540 [Streptomyces sp. MUM 178J]